MTSINAIRFNRNSGAMVFDEKRGWNEQGMVIQSAQKIKPIVDEHITLHTGLVAGYGNTGSSSIGDELRLTIRQRIRQNWQREVDKTGQKPPHFMTVEDVARLTYNIICEMKHKHTNELLQGRYGFTTADFIQGSYKTTKGDTIEIKERKILEDAEKAITWKGENEIASPVFGNAGLIAGYDEKEGFQIFHFSLMEQYCLPVQEAFVVDGSGRDQCQLVLSDFITEKNIRQRRGEIEPKEGLYAIIKAIVISSRINLGVGGYSNIILIDGSKKHAEKMKLIVDDRARLASEIVKASLGKFITEEKARELLAQLCFENTPWGTINKELFQKSQTPEKLKKYLRGYGYRE